MAATIPPDYEQRVYAGWLGKCIGVRLGAPVEGWTCDEIRTTLGPIEGYVNEQPGRVFQPDDDTSLPLIAIRALEDYGISADLSAAQIGETWLNYLGDQHGTLWWGGYGVSSEHTAYLNLAGGIPAPRSGSIAQNGAIIAEQIGGQIFSDVWGLVAPGDPALAAALAARASSVSHDGNGIYGGRFIAALVSQAFGERDPLRLIETGLALIPAQSEYARVVRDVLAFHRQQPGDWRACCAFLHAHYGYDRYPGMVHIIPNAGVVVMALAYSGADFSRAIQIATMAGWDTDCNAGNVGAILGVAGGLEGIAGRWRAPINDRLIAASVIGTRNLRTIPQCADELARLGRQLAGEAPPAPRARYHFAYPGATNAFEARGPVVDLRQTDETPERPALRASLRAFGGGEVRLFTRTYYRPAELTGNFYQAAFSPLIYPGQTARALLYLPPDAPETIRAALYVRDDNHAQTHQALAAPLAPGAWQWLSFAIPPLEGACLSEVGVVLRNVGPAWETGAFYLGALDWDGAPDYRLDFAAERPASGAISQWTRLRGYWRLEEGAYHGSGPGECESYTGDIAWRDYGLEAQVIPLSGDWHAINVRVQGALRSYALGLAPGGRVALYKKERAYREVASADFPWQHGVVYTLRLKAAGATLTGQVAGEGGVCRLEWADDGGAYLNGQVGLTVRGGHARFVSMRVAPE